MRFTPRGGTFSSTGIAQQAAADLHRKTASARVSVTGGSFWAGAVLPEQFHGTFENLDLGFELPDPLLRFRQLDALRDGDPGAFSAVDLVLADLTGSRRH